MSSISVIVPVYNTENYLPRCLDSLLNQTFLDFEILLIDDGSTDNSLAVCRQYAAKDSRVKVIKTKHVGVSAVRNLGLDNAKGKYIMFCDSDDYVERDWIEELYDAAEEHPNALCNCEYALSSPSVGYVKKQGVPNLTKSQVIEKRAFFPLLCYGQMMHLWTRIFRRDVILSHKLRFQKVEIEGEDMIFIYHYLRFCDSFYFIHKCLYYWTDNGTNTITRGFQPYYFEDMKQIYLARKEHIAPEFLQDFYNYSFERFMRCPDFVWDKRNTDNKRIKKQYCKRIFCDSAFQETVKNVNTKACSRKKRLVLRTGNYSLYRLLSRLSKIVRSRSSRY